MAIDPMVTNPEMHMWRGLETLLAILRKPQRLTFFRRNGVGRTETEFISTETEFVAQKRSSNSIPVETNSNPVRPTPFLRKKVSLRGFRTYGTSLYPHREIIRTCNQPRHPDNVTHQGIAISQPHMGTCAWSENQRPPHIIRLSCWTIILHSLSPAIYSFLRAYLSWSDGVISWFVMICHDISW